ncbi:MAG: LysM peptidoglycan-binding domain-containing protein [Planctomycetes bacterium]|nr:LysM peptidoglycan-binding domain-containing protein [Planctomycetota bacterium]
MGTKGKLLIIALLMSGIVSLLVWSKNGSAKKATPTVGSANKGAVDEVPAADDPNARPGPDSGDRYHLPPDEPGDGGLRVETADNGSRTPPVVNQDSHPEVVRPAPPATAARTYKVEPGDSLAKIATKIYGKETAWKLIYDANKDKMSSPDDLLRVGTALVIPAGAPENKPPANDTVTAPKKNDPPTKDVVVKNDPPKETPKVEGAKKTYKVKAGDTLSSIAKALLGDSNKWKAIYTANKEKLPHPDTLIEGMELSIP